MHAEGIYPYDRCEQIESPPGPWQKEPNQTAWIEPRTRLRCAMMRNRFGVWCGYVGVPHAHPAAGKPLGSSLTVPHDFRLEIEERRVQIGRDVGIMDLLFIALDADASDAFSRDEVPLTFMLPSHGGLTYSQAGDGGLWWFGFDCGHAGDLIPAFTPIHEMIKRSLDRPSLGDHDYRDHDYVYGCVVRLAWALQEVEQIINRNVAAKTTSTS